MRGGASEEFALSPSACKQASKQAQDAPRVRIEFTRPEKLVGWRSVSVYCVGRGESVGELISLGNIDSRGRNAELCQIRSLRLKETDVSDIMKIEIQSLFLVYLIMVFWNREFRSAS